MIIVIIMFVVFLFNDIKMIWMIKNLYGIELKLILILVVFKRFIYKMYILYKIIGEIFNLIYKLGYF